MQQKYGPHFSIAPKTKDDLAEFDLLAQSLTHPMNQLISQKPDLYKKNENEITAYIRARSFLQIKKDQPIGKRLLREINGIIVSKSDESALSSFQSNGCKVYSLKGRPAYLSPIDSEMYIDSLIEWMKEDEYLSLPLLIQAAIIHYQIVKIHPFFDGNGRTARLISNHILFRGGLDINLCYQIEEYLEVDKIAYYDALDFHNNNLVELYDSTRDISSWIEYFCTSLIKCLQKIQKS